MMFDREKYNEQLDTERCEGCGRPIEYEGDGLRLCSDCLVIRVRLDTRRYTPTPYRLRED